MKELLFSSLVLLVFACGTSEDAVKDEQTSSTDSTMAVTDSTITPIGDTLNVDLPIEDDTVRAITHGSPDQEKLDSIKKEKGEKKK